MLYEIGMMLVLVSCAFCEGPLLVPVTIVAVGLVFMELGRRTDNDNQGDTEG